MSRTQQARRRLKGHWPEAAAVEFITVLAGMLIPLASLAALRLSGLGAERVIHARELFGQWLYALITLVMLAADWLLLSPLMLGRMAFYWNIAAGGSAPVHLIFKYYGRRYTHALRWRISVQLRRLMYWAFCLSPAAFASGIAKAVRKSGSGTPVSDVILLFCALFGVLLFIAGLLFSEALMLRGLPAAFLVITNETEKYPKRLFKRSSKIMKGHLTDTFQLVTGFGGWFASCLLIFPYFYVMPLFFTTRTVAVRKFILKSISRTAANHDNAATQDTIQLPSIKDKKQPC